MTSTPRPVGGSCLQSSDPIPNEENAHMYNSFTGIAGQVEPQKLTRLESNDKSVGSDNSASTGNTTLFYPDEIPSKPKNEYITMRACRIKNCSYRQNKRNIWYTDK